MTVTAVLALFAAMAVLAAVPGLSVLVVSVRAATLGFPHGAAAAAGVVAGDLLFILLAVYGLALLLEALGETFYVVEYLGGAYLVWLAIYLWRPQQPLRTEEGPQQESLFASFLAGLLLTLGDQKAVLFYLGFLPAFVELESIRLVQVAVIAAVTVVAVGGVKLIFAAVAAKAGAGMSAQPRQWLNRAAAAVMLAVGLFVIVRAAAEGV